MGGVMFIGGTWADPEGLAEAPTHAPSLQVLENSPGEGVDGFLSKEYGLCNWEPIPLLPMDGPFAIWEEVGARLAEANKSGDYTLLKELPTLDAGAVPEQQLKRSAMLLGAMAHSWAHLGPGAENGGFPAGIWEPWEKVNLRMGRPSATMTYQDYFTLNLTWRSGCGGEGQHFTDESVLSDTEVSVKAFGQDNELWFIRYNFAMDWFSRGMPLDMAQAQQAVLEEDESDLADALLRLQDHVKALSRWFGAINPHPLATDYCCPVVWSKTVGKIIPPAFKGERSLSGLQNSSIHLMDIFLGRGSYKTDLGDLALDERKGWLPSLHLQFFQALSKVSVRDFIVKSGNRRLRRLYNQLLDLWTGPGEHSWMERHRLKMADYLELGMKTSREKSSGDTASGDWGQTRAWETVDQMCVEATRERFNELCIPDAWYVPVLLREIEDVGVDSSRLVFDVKDTGLSFEPGDRVRVLPTNSPQQVLRTVNALEASGSHEVPLAEEWLRFATCLGLREAMEYGTLQLSEFLQHAAVRPLSEQVAESIIGVLRTESSDLEEIVATPNTLKEFEFWDFVELCKQMNPNCSSNLPELIENLAEVLPPLCPRRYSIVSAGVGEHKTLEIVVGQLWYTSEADALLPEAKAAEAPAAPEGEGDEDPADDAPHCTVARRSQWSVMPPRASISRLSQVVAAPGLAEASGDHPVCPFGYGGGPAAGKSCPFGHGDGGPVGARRSVAARTSVARGRMSLFDTILISSGRARASLAVPEPGPGAQRPSCKMGRAMPQANDGGDKQRTLDILRKVSESRTQPCAGIPQRLSTISGASGGGQAGAEATAVCREGCCSTFLRHFAIGRQVHIQVESVEHFHMPCDHATPVVMFGLGSGAAPFQGFVGQGAGKHELWLFWGARSVKDLFNWKEFWAHEVVRGSLNARLAFSRDTAPLGPTDWPDQPSQAEAAARWHVATAGAQSPGRLDTLLQTTSVKEELAALLRRNASIYICGQPVLSNVVRDGIIGALESTGVPHAEASRQYLDLVANGRIRSDLFSSSSASDGKARTSIARSEVARHCHPEDCWVILAGHVYNLTGFVMEHPGGPKIIMDKAGRDCTEDYDRAHGLANSRITGMFAPYYLGPLRRPPRNSKTCAAVVVMLDRLLEAANVFRADWNHFAEFPRCLPQDEHSFYRDCQVHGRFARVTVPVVLRAVRDALCAVRAAGAPPQEADQKLAEDKEVKVDCAVGLAKPDCAVGLAKPGNSEELRQAICSDEVWLASARDAGTELLAELERDQELSPAVVAERLTDLLGGLTKQQGV